MEAGLEAEDQQARSQIEWEAEPLLTLRQVIAEAEQGSQPPNGLGTPWYVTFDRDRTEEQIAVNGAETWAYVVERDGGLRVKFSIDDWEGMRLYRGQWVPVRLPGKADQWFYPSEVVEIPPTVWVLMAQRVRAVG